jgi:phosphoribosylaminoimidazolecarboxamide formyltransferase/IMP cyclohydrolase
MELRKIRTALISVYHKEGLEEIVRELARLDVRLISTGGTKTFIESMGLTVTAVEALTGYPSILGGRVKTLHPKIFGGILNRRDSKEDQEQLKQYDIESIDLVIVDLYPFEEAASWRGRYDHGGRGDPLKQGTDSPDRETDRIEEAIELIDIGGIALIRAAAKNFNDTVIISSRDQYAGFLELLKSGSGSTDISQRRQFSAKAFGRTSAYDTAIMAWMTEDVVVNVAGDQTTVLRYGENPHQKGRFHGNLDAVFEKLHGKELSYNNIVDMDAAVNLIAEFDKPTVAIIKHTNSCGLAERDDIAAAWEAALACDPVSAFGGIVIANRRVDKATAAAINEIFIEVMIAPGYDFDALEILKSKKNRIIVTQKTTQLPHTIHRTALNGLLEMDKDLSIQSEGDFKVVTKRAPTSAEVSDLIFANKAAKHMKSNTIALVKDGQLIGMGTGQTSRVDALRQAIDKAGRMGFKLKGAVMASDAFFPFADCVEIADRAGITAVVQPGGSIRDKDSIEYCDKAGMAMVLTGVRHFKH